MSNFRKGVEFLKLAWMAFWRLCILSIFIHTTLTTVTLVSIGVAVLMVFVLRRSMFIHPVWNLFKRRTLTYPLGGSFSASRKPRITKTPSSSQTWLDKTTKTGFMTGYEPRKMQSVPVPTPTNHQRMNGSPGGGLHNANFSQSSIQIGTKGEVSFAKILESNGILDFVDSYWSVSMPSESGFIRDSKFNTDIDCILVVGKTVYLVDVKMYIGGDGTYRMDSANSLVLYDNTTGQPVKGSKKHMSKNMAMATDRFKKILPGRYRVESCVVFVPTDRGMPTIKPGTVSWPGNIPAMTIVDFMSKLAPNASRNNAPTDKTLHSKLVRLLRN